MRNLFSSRKRIAVAAAGVAVLFGGVTALAYWTTTGSGTGTVTAAPSNGTVVLHGSINVTSHAPYPGGANPVTFTADNAGATNLYVTKIHLASVVAYDSLADAATNDGSTGVVDGCSTADFSMADVTSNTVVLASASGQAVTGVGSLVYANTLVDQSLCKSAVLVLNLTSN